MLHELIICVMKMSKQFDPAVYLPETWWPQFQVLRSWSPAERSRWTWCPTFPGSWWGVAGMHQTSQRCTSRWSRTVSPRASVPTSPWFYGNTAGTPCKKHLYTKPASVSWVQQRSTNLTTLMDISFFKKTKIKEEMSI